MIRELITNLKLRVKVAWIGPHLDSYVRQRTEAHKPVLFFNWKPSYITTINNYTNIAFPRCEDIHHTDLQFPSNCAFEINQLNKVAWSGLQQSGADAMQLVKGLRFTQCQYQELLDSFVHKLVLHLNSGVRFTVTLVQLNRISIINDILHLLIAVCHDNLWQM